MVETVARKISTLFCRIFKNLYSICSEKLYTNCSKRFLLCLYDIASLTATSWLHLLESFLSMLYKFFFSFIIIMSPPCKPLHTGYVSQLCQLEPLQWLPCQPDNLSATMEILFLVVAFVLICSYKLTGIHSYVSQFL